MHPSDPLALGFSAWQRTQIEALLDELFDLPEPMRLAALHERSVEDPAVLAEVQSLLRAAAASGDFLKSQAVLAAGDFVDDFSVGARLGAWRLTRLIGRGGMGEVYEGVRADGDFKQRVAIKLLQREAGTQLERFQSERQILALLEFSGIARLYDGGVSEDGRPYMVMEYVEGLPITEYCEINGSTLEQRLRLFIQVCAAVAYAHRHLIVHRDLKPSNILATAGGEVKLLDFGIAKLMDEQRSRVTQASMAPLTPRCAAPEQLTGEPITTAADVYALGLLLFELLTGSHPWMGTDTPMLQAIRTILQKAAPAPSEIAAGRASPPVAARLIRGDLDAIVAKALRKEPQHRYVTVEALKLDVERVLNSEPIQAREGARLYLIGRTLRRHRWTAAAAAAIFLSLATGLGVAAWQAERASNERDAARRDAAREEAVRDSLTRMFRSAITDKGAQPTTAKEMIDSSAQRVLREYREKPQLAGEIVLTLADLYGALEDVNGSGALLEGYLAEASPSMDPRTMADARTKLAAIELMRGKPDSAATLLDQADAFWAITPRRYGEERLEGLSVRGRLQRTRGDFDGAIATNRQAIVEREALSGHEHRETAGLYNTLAITLAAASRYDEALQAYRETTAIYETLGLGDGIDAQIIVANTGILELRTGHLAEARDMLKSSVDKERALAGDSAAVAAALGCYGKTLSILDRNSEAVPVLLEATDMGSRYAGVSSPVAIQNRVFLGEAQAALGDRAAANDSLRAADAAALAKFGAAHSITLRIEELLAMLTAADGKFGAAETRLADVVSGLRKPGPNFEINLAHALESLGDVQISAGHFPQAVKTLQEAVALREKAPGDIWELALARERLGEALAKMGSTAAPALLKKAAADLESQLGGEHPQTLRAKNALASLSV